MLGTYRDVGGGGGNGREGRSINQEFDGVSQGMKVFMERIISAHWRMTAQYSTATRPNPEERPKQRRRESSESSERKNPFTKIR